MRAKKSRVIGETESEVRANLSKEIRRSIIAIWIAIVLLFFNLLYGVYQNRKAHQLLWANMNHYIEMEMQDSKELNQYLNKLNLILEKQDQLVGLHNK